MESSPNIDRDIINVFNKKFGADYPKVRKPIICNGLKEVIIYKSDDEEEDVSKKDKSQTVEPEPEADTLIP